MKDFFQKINWMTVAAICFGIWLVLCLIYEILPTHAAEVSNFGSDGFLLEDWNNPYEYIGPVFNHDSSYIGGRGTLEANTAKLYQIDVNNSNDNIEGDMSLTYRCGELGKDDWNGSMTTTGFNIQSVRVIKGVVCPYLYQDNSGHAQFYVSTKNWVATSDIPEPSYAHGSQFIFKGLDGVVYCVYGEFDYDFQFRIKSDGCLDTNWLNTCGTFHVTTAELMTPENLWTWVYGGLDLNDISDVFVSKILSVPSATRIETKHNVTVECTKFGVGSSGGATPTPAPSGAYDTYSFMFNTGYSTNVSYYLVDVKCHRANALLTPNQNNAVNYVRGLFNNYEDLTFMHNALVLRNGSYGGSFAQGYPSIQLYVPVSDLDFEVSYYYIGNQYISNFQYIRDNYTPTVITAATSDTATNLVRTLAVDGGYILCAGHHLGNYAMYYTVATTGQYYVGDGIETYYKYDSSLDISSLGFNFASSGNDNQKNTSSWRWAIEYMTGLTNMPEPTPSPTPTPDPNATPTPTPTATPTPPPHVIINWPTSTPTPTPFIPFNPPGGNGDDDIKPNTTRDVLTDGMQWLRRNTTDGVLATAFSFLPSELQYLFWLFVFILIVAAVIRLCIHFGGG